VRGFRGYLREQTFRFDTPIIILFGENRCGKSSTLNALEWCLFGDDVVGVESSGIRERKEWEVANRHLDPQAVFVELHFDTDDGQLIVRRTLAKAAGRANLREALELTLPDGEKITDPIAKHHLDQRLGRASFRDFMTTVYQHQETIRNIVTQKPEESNDAIDRILGLSDYRNYLAAIKQANARQRLKRALQKQDDFRYEVGKLISWSSSELENKRRAAIKAGIVGTPLTGALALQVAEEALQAIAQFARETSVEVGSLALPQEWEDLAAFEKLAQDTITSMRGRVPETEVQNQLLQRRRPLTELRINLEGNKNKQRKIADNLRDLDKRYGGQQSVSSQIDLEKAKREAKEKELQETDSQVALIQKAIEFLEQANADDLAGRCPLCTNQAPDLLRTLRAQLEGALRGRIAEINQAIQSHADRLKALKPVAERYDKANDEQQRLVDEFAQLRDQASKLLKRDLDDTQDAIAILNTAENSIGDRLQELQGAIDARQERLNKMSADFVKVRLIWEFLDLQERCPLLTGFNRVISLRLQRRCPAVCDDGSRERRATRSRPVSCRRIACRQFKIHTICGACAA
jgi:DNA repair exonuclease SbcCD ATPase subunit